MEGKIGLSPVVIDITAKTSPTLDELMFGSVVILLLNFLWMEYVLKRHRPLWKHLVILLCSDCAFLINNYVKILAPGIYGPVIGLYGIAFFVVYMLLMYREPRGRVLSWELVPGFFMGLFYTFGVIAFEGLWRVGFWAQDMRVLFTNPKVTYVRTFCIAVCTALLAWAAQRLIDKSSAKKKAVQ
jgi:hypothetical protein